MADDAGNTAAYAAGMLPTGQSMRALFEELLMVDRIPLHTLLRGASPEAFNGMQSWLNVIRDCNIEDVRTAAALHLENALLWRLEDAVRERQYSAEYRMNCKEAIDRCNAARNMFVTRFDTGLGQTLDLPKVGYPIMVNTPGTVLDRLSIAVIRQAGMPTSTPEGQLTAACVSEFNRQIADLLSGRLTLPAWRLNRRYAAQDWPPPENDMHLVFKLANENRS